MSSLIVLQSKDTFVFASDTALSANYNNHTFRIDNNEKKLFEYDYFVMFVSGKKWLRDLFLSYIDSNSSVEDIKYTLDNYILPYCQNEFGLEIVIGMKDLSKVIFFSSIDSFKYKESINDSDNTNIFTAGYKTKEIAEIFSSIFAHKSLIESLQETYQKVSCDEIGGSLDIYHIASKKIKEIKLPIDEIMIYTENSINDYLHNLVVAERLIGRLILGNKLQIIDEVGVVTIQSGRISIDDDTGKTRVQLGNYPNPDNPSQLKYGLNIIDGSMDFRTTSTPNRGTQLDGNGIRTFNSNSVRTFNVDASTGLVEIVGSLSIRTSTNSNRGVTIDGNGIKGYNGSGQVKFEINSQTGDAWFGGRLESATGTLDRVSGTVNNLGGTFAGTLNGVDGNFTGTLTAVNGTFRGELQAATGEFQGLVTGSLSAQTVNSIRITADQIDALRITADMIDVTDLSAISANIGNITSGTINTVSLNGVNINTTQDISVGRNIQLQGSGANSIRFASSSFISSAGDGTLNIEAFNDLNITASTTYFFGRVDFTNATVSGI